MPKILRSSFDVDKLKRSLIMNKVTPNMLHNLYVSLPNSYSNI